MILLIDNYDSFSYNLVQLTGSIDPSVEVIRNKDRTTAEIEQMAPEAIILSPGPGRPADAGVTEDVVRTFRGRIPLLGVCLGHQAICEAYGGQITYAHTLMHGKQDLVRVDTEDPLFRELPEEIEVGRYHSLAADRKSLPPDLHVISEAQDGEVMAVSDRAHAVWGIQFHPESIMTPEGKRIMENFLSAAKEFHAVSHPQV